MNTPKSHSRLCRAVLAPLLGVSIATTSVARAEEWRPPAPPVRKAPTGADPRVAEGFQVAGAIVVGIGGTVGIFGLLGCMASDSFEGAATSDFGKGMWITSGSIAGAGVLTLVVATIVRASAPSVRPPPPSGNFVPTVDLLASSHGAGVALGWSF